jgi:hypothetical protein
MAYFGIYDVVGKMDEINNKFVVYTALFGDYDDLIDPKENYKGCDFVCFTDQKHLKSDIWEIRIIDKIDLPLNMMNRKYKWLPHKYLSNYIMSLYIDSNIALLQNPFKLLEKYSANKWLFLLPKHPLRDCIYDEAFACIERNKVTISNLIEQIKFYKQDNFPNNFGIGENNILYRIHNNRNVIELMENLWKDLNKWNTKRDQLSLFYLVWKIKFKKIVLMNENARDELNFSIQLHNKFENRTFIQKVKDKLFYTKQKVLNTKIYSIKLEKNKNE